MDKEYTILHISDLHKSEEDSYTDLMESLRMDCETYEQEGIKKPEIIVVSGDIAEGAEGPDADAKIERQYAEATSFLQQLTEFFLDGDKTRLIYKIRSMTTQSHGPESSVFSGHVHPKTVKTL